MRVNEQYWIDETNDINEDLVIHIKGKGAVIIKSNLSGVSVDIYPLHAVDEPIFTGYVLSEDFLERF
jgi:hypothetical protein